MVKQRKGHEMKYILADVLGNFGEYRNEMIPTTGKPEDTKQIIEAIIRAKYSDIPVAYKITADIHYRNEAMI